MLVFAVAAVLLCPEGGCGGCGAQCGCRDSVLSPTSSLAVGRGRGRRAAVRAVVAVVDGFSGHSGCSSADGRAGDFAAAVPGLTFVSGLVRGDGGRGPAAGVALPLHLLVGQAGRRGSDGGRGDVSAGVGLVAAARVGGVD